MTQPLDPILTIDETAQRLKINPITLWRWERDGVFPKRIQIGPRRRGHYQSTVEAYLASRPTGCRGI